METMELHRGPLVDHIQLAVADLAASRRFYDALFEVLDVPLAADRMLSEKVEAGFELAGALAGGRINTPEAATRKALTVTASACEATASAWT